MKSLTLRIYLAVVAVLLLFALAAAWLAQRNLDHDREFLRRGMAYERYHALGELIENSLPAASEPAASQAQAMLALSKRLRVPMALDDAKGQRVATSPAFDKWTQRHPTRLTPQSVGQPEAEVFRQSWADGRTFWLLRAPGGMMGNRPPPPPNWLPFFPWMPANLLVVLLILFIAIALGAWPVANHLTRRLKALRLGVERFGDGHLQHRVEVQGKDEVADLARSFNEAADRIESLVTAHRSLLANASHELRSPLARLKMAMALMGDASPERTQRLQSEIHQDISELDALVEEVLLASRLDAQAPLNLRSVDVVGLLVEEAQHVQANVHLEGAEHQAGASAVSLMADERLLRRAVRNLLENARRYGVDGRGLHVGEASSPVDVRLLLREGWLDVAVEDRGPGVPLEQQERIFEPFYRMPGHAEHAGGVGLGLSLVRQIAVRHGGQVRCESREGGGSRFVISLPR